MSHPLADIMPKNDQLNAGKIVDRTALLIASAAQGKTQVVELLLSMQPTNDAINIAMAQAVTFNRLDVMKQLLISGATADEAAFTCAITHGRHDLVELILQYVDPTINDNFAINTAANGNEEMMRVLLRDRRITQCNRAFEIASVSGHAKIVRMLMDYGVDPAMGGNYAIKVAATYGHTDVVVELLKDPRVDCMQAFSNACVYRHTDVVAELLKDPRVDPAVNNNYAIKSAASTGNKIIVELLLLDARTSAHIEALKYASHGDKLEVVELLLNRLGHRVSISDYVYEYINYSPEVSNLWKQHIVKYRWIMVQFLREHLSIDLLDQFT